MSRRRLRRRVASCAALILAAWGCSGPPASPPPAAPRVAAIPAPSAPKPAEEATDHPAAEEGPRTSPTLWAVVIGINQYDRQGAIQNAGNSATGNAATFAEWLIQGAGWPDDHVRTLLDAAAGSPTAPTAANIRRAMTEWLPARARPDLGDTVVIYYAGQAVGLPPATRVPGAPTREFLLPTDADRQGWKNGWALDEDIDRLAKVPGLNIVCLLDTSLKGRGQPIRSDQAIREEHEPKALPFLAKLSRWPGVSASISDDGGVAEDTDRFARLLIGSQGDRDRQTSLRQALAQIQRDPEALRRGFQSVGGFDPRLSLWRALGTASIATDPELVLQRGHSAEVLDARFLDDGTLVTAGRDSAAKFWRPEDRFLLRELPGWAHNAGVEALAISADGRRLASADASGRVRFWDLTRPRVDSGEVALDPRARAEKDPPPHDSPVRRVAFVADGRRAVSWDAGEGLVVAWDLRGEQPKVQAELGRQVIALAAPSAEGPIALLTADLGGQVLAYGPDLADPKPLRLTPGPVQELFVSADGRRLAARDASGVAVVREIGAERNAYEHAFDPDSELLALDDAGRIALREGRSLRLAGVVEGPGVPLEVPAQPVLAAFGPAARDGRLLAVGSAVPEGLPNPPDALSLWRIDEAGAAVPLDLGRSEPGRQPTCLSFRADGRLLAVGDQAGGVRLWRLDPSPTPLMPLPFHRGQIAGLAASADGRLILHITRDAFAHLWDMKGGRGAQPLDGRWTAAAIASAGDPRSARLFLTDKDRGDVVELTYDTELNRVVARRVLPRPIDARGRDAAFGPTSKGDGSQLLAASPDGRWVAASSTGHAITCLWDTREGTVRVLKGDDFPDTALAFADDSTALLTADQDGTARVWDLADLDRPAKVYRRPGLAVSAAAFLPKAEGRARVVTAHRLPEPESSEVCFWADDPVRPFGGGEGLAGVVRAMAVAPDGRSLVMGGSDKALWIRGLDVNDPFRPLEADGDHRHGEQINAMATWPGAPVLLSAGDDGTIRAWRPEAGGLLGTLSPSVEAPDAPAEAARGPRALSDALESSWVAFTPGLAFDSSPGGEARVSWLFEGRVRRLDQLAETHRVSGLLALLHRGESPPPRPLPSQPEPRVSIDWPGIDVVDPPDTSIDLIVRLGGDEPLTNVRLYQNNVPVRLRESVPGHERALTFSVPLLPGRNEFVAMAGRDDPEVAGVVGTIDGRSDPGVVVVFNGRPIPGRVHVLALGVSNYANRPLQYAHADALAIAKFLEERGAKGGVGAGLNRVLINDDVKLENVERALEDIAEAVRDHPEDTVVIFLAGHAVARMDQFCLLLSPYPFLAPPFNATGLPLLVQRAAFDAAEVPASEEDKVALPFVAIYRQLARLDARNRLIVVDACQAEMARDDPGIARVRAALESGAHRARTEFVLASRRGEAAAEASIVGHGLLTYSILRGLGGPARPLPGEPAAFADTPSADLNRDDLVTSDELRRYIDRTLPSLCEHFDRMVRGEQLALRGPIPADRRALRPARQSLRSRLDGDRGFPLIRMMPNAGPVDRPR